MKKKILHSILLVFTSFYVISCSDEYNHSEDLNQDAKFSEFIKLTINNNEKFRNNSSVLLNPFVDPNTLSSSEIEALSQRAIEVYQEIKAEYLLRGGDVSNFNNYFAAELTDGVAAVVYPIYLDSTDGLIATTNDLKTCWAVYLRDLTISMMDYSVSLAGCVRNPITLAWCGAEAFTQYAVATYGNYRTFSACVKDVEANQ